MFPSWVVGAPSSNTVHALVAHGPDFQGFPAETNRNKLYVNKQDPKETEVTGFTS